MFIFSYFIQKYLVKFNTDADIEYIAFLVHSSSSNSTHSLPSVTMLPLAPLSSAFSSCTLRCTHSSTILPSTPLIFSSTSLFQTPPEASDS